ncbi:MFS transporter [Parafrankia sp. EUN1f]|uniref:MFS transporter n=1 Tax=Parafrankia sp. EUN1f TaxID=102897 RepID=UPI0001C44E67|nr:MFS transporter [Parafrankia sp. EUN1f]EFC83363.1 drug resistance transporter, EmrB/QacA subfamily [Parafrankia sp. EUN1f]
MSAQELDTVAAESAGQVGDVASAAPARRDNRLRIALGVIVICQLMVIIDGTIVNVALAKIQKDLDFSPSSLAWIQSAYSLAFGGLLLLGGRAGDVFGRLRLFIGGLALFTLASLAAGLAPSAGALITARAAQGVGAAFAAPASLALLATTFKDGTERQRALGVFSMIAGLGLTLGLILGGLLSTASWRWVFVINVPFGIGVIALARPFLQDTPRHPARFDVAGAAVSTAGMVSLVYGFIRAASDGWSDGLAVAMLAAGVVLLLGFLAIEANVGQPIMPLRLFGARSRAGAYINMLFLSAAMGSTFFFLSLFIQRVLDLSPLQTGLAFLPMAAVQFGSARTAPKLVARLGPKAVIMAGTLVAMVAALWLTQLDGTTTYPGGLVGPLILVGLGIGLAFMPLNMVILAELPPRDTGSASGLLQCLQQIGLAVGIAVLTTVYSTSLRDSAHHPNPALSPQEQLHHDLGKGIAASFVVLVAFIAVALAVTVLVFKRRPRPVPAVAVPASPQSTSSDA